jgi:hypothetical protein
VWSGNELDSNLNLFETFNFFDIDDSATEPLSSFFGNVSLLILMDALPF